MGMVLHDEIACSIKKQFALMKKDYGYGQWNWSCISISGVAGLISVCLHCQLSVRWDLSPGLLSFRFIHSNGEVAFRPRVRAADRCMGRKSAQTQFTEQELDDSPPPPPPTHLFYESWPHIFAGCHVDKSKTIYFWSVQSVLFPWECFVRLTNTL